MNITIKFNTDNDSFSNFDNEIDFVLYQLGLKLKSYELTGNIIDSNGNSIGYYQKKLN